jgi:hypothetical protein
LSYIWPLSWVRLVHNSSLLDPRLRGTAFRFGVRRAGRFVILNYSYGERLETPADAAPRHYAGGGSIVLMRTANGWREVSRSSWVT